MSAIKLKKMEKCKNCEHAKKWHLPKGDLKGNWCKHKDKTYGVYDCMCQEFAQD